MVDKVLRDAGRTLEEEMEFSNITDLRQDFLRKIEDIQKNPSKRVLILKHGRPQAVLMSSDAYEVLKRVVDLFLEQASGLSREQSISAAIQRFETERSSVPAEAAVPAQTANSKLAAS